MRPPASYACSLAASPARLLCRSLAAAVYRVPSLFVILFPSNPLFGPPADHLDKGSVLALNKRFDDSLRW